MTTEMLAKFLSHLHSASNSFNIISRTQTQLYLV